VCVCVTVGLRRFRRAATAALFVKTLSSSSLLDSRNRRQSPSRTVRPPPHVCTVSFPPRTPPRSELTALPRPPSWRRRGVMVSGVRRMNEVNARRARLLPGWVTASLGGHTISVCNKPTRSSTQPCIPPGSLNRVPASAEIRAGMSPLPGGR